LPEFLKTAIKIEKQWHICVKMQIPADH
jgi:hypothetical protein